MSKYHPKTKLVQSGLSSDKAHHAVIPPIYTSTTYEVQDLAQRGVYEYSRTQNPTRDVFAAAMAELEGGYGACITASGMAALTIILHVLDAGDLLLAPYDCYGRSYKLISALAEKGHFQAEFCDFYSKAAIDEAFDKKAPKLVLIESPSNPLMRIADIEAIAEKCKAASALLVVDNTFLTPILQNPIALGADIVYHSTTKFINGHSDVIGGAVIAKDEAVHTELASWNNALGTIASPFDSYLALRGMRTLDLRVRAAEQNAGRVLEYLEQSSKVAQIYYPGLENHDGHAIAKKQQSGYGSMLAFEIDGDEKAARKFLGALQIFRLAQSLGGVESLVCQPSSMTHASMDDAAQARAGIKKTLVRLSIGIEDAEDLIADLDQAFNAI